MQIDDPRIFTAQSVGERDTLCLADLGVLTQVIGDSHQPLYDLDEASRLGRVVLITNVDPSQNVTGSVVMRLLIDEPIPASLADNCREELSGCTLEVPNGSIILAPVALIRSNTYEDEPPAPEKIVTNVSIHGTVLEVPPGLYHVEVHSVRYGEGRRHELIKGALSDTDLDDWNRWESWRNVGCGVGCLGSFLGLAAAMVLRAIKLNQWALWMAITAGALALVGSLHFWIVGRSSRYRQLQRLYNAAQGDFPHAIFRLTSAEEPVIDGRPAKCGWVFNM